MFHDLNITPFNVGTISDINENTPSHKCERLVLLPWCPAWILAAYINPEITIQAKIFYVFLTNTTPMALSVAQWDINKLKLSILLDQP